VTPILATNSLQLHIGILREGAENGQKRRRYGVWGDAMKMEMKRKLPQIVAFWRKSLPICLPTITQTHRNG
jgi:hypothetical protein